MLRNIVLCFICLLIIGGCKGSSIDAAGYVENTVAGLEMPPSYGIVTGVRYITIQNDTGYNTAGTITGGTLEAFGHVMNGGASGGHRRCSCGCIGRAGDAKMAGA
jgi:outer membrane lipoprotein SlyB